jgi:hypothetical protein
MLLLTSTSDLVRVVTGQTPGIDVHASWVDLASGVVTPGRTNTKITTATTTSIVGSPAASTQRNVKTINIKNIHATNSNAITVDHTDGTNAIELYEITLLAGEMLHYSDETGWTLFDATGIPKVVQLAFQTRQLTGDQSNSTTTLTEVTGLKLVSVGPGTFQFTYMVIYQAAATTTGVRFSVEHTGTVTSFVANMRWVDDSSAASTGAADQNAVGAAGQVVAAMAARAASTTGWGTTISVDTANANCLMIIEGTLVVSATGQLQLWHGSEVAAASTVKAGSSIVLIKITE